MSWRFLDSMITRNRPNRLATSYMFQYVLTTETWWYKGFCSSSILSIFDGLKPGLLHVQYKGEQIQHIWPNSVVMQVELRPAPHGCVFRALRCDPSRCVHAYAWTHRDGSQRNTLKKRPCGAGVRATHTSYSFSLHFYLLVDILFIANRIVATFKCMYNCIVCSVCYKQCVESVIL